MIKENHPDNNVGNIEYVSKQDAKDYIDSQHGRPFIGCTVGEAMKIMIDEVKPADVVPVVRCRNCKFYTPMNRDFKTGICDLNVHHMGDNGFCSCGERGKKNNGRSQILL